MPKIAKTPAEIVAFVEPLARRRSFDQDEPEELTWSTRAHGSVGDETPGKEDVAAAREIGRQVEGAFSNVRVELETVDEWTNFTVRMYPQALSPRKPSSSELNKNLFSLEERITQDLLDAKAITKSHHVHISTTGRSMWVSPSIDDLGSSWEIQILKTTPDRNLPNEEIVLRAGRHQVKLDTGSPEDIYAAWKGLAKTTDNYRDVYPIVYLMSTRDGFLKDPWQNGCTCPPEKAYKLESWQLEMPGIIAQIQQHSAKLVKWRRGYAPEPV